MADVRQYILEYNLEEGKAKGAKETFKFLLKALHPKITLMRGTKKHHRWVRRGLSKIGRAFKEK